MRINNCQHCQPKEAAENKNITMRITRTFCYIICETCNHVIASMKWEEVLKEWNSEKRSI